MAFTHLVVELDTGKILDRGDEQYCMHVAKEVFTRAGIPYATVMEV